MRGWNEWFQPVVLKKFTYPRRPVEYGLDLKGASVVPAVEPREPVSDLERSDHDYLCPAEGVSDNGVVFRIELLTVGKTCNDESDDGAREADQYLLRSHFILWTPCEPGQFPPSPTSLG